jgi:hypothetical protein
MVSSLKSAVVRGVVGSHRVYTDLAGPALANREQGYLCLHHCSYRALERLGQGDLCMI